MLCAEEEDRNTKEYPIRILVSYSDFIRYGEKCNVYSATTTWTTTATTNRRQKNLQYKGEKSRSEEKNPRTSLDHVQKLQLPIDDTSDNNDNDL